MLEPAAIDALVAETNRRFVIGLHVDRRRFVLRPWWATLTHGVAIVGDYGGGVWRARSRRKLEARMRRRVERMAQRFDIAEPVIRVEGPAA